VFEKTKMHFNHLIKPSKTVIARPYLVAIMARGAAALGANCQGGFDMVFPFLYNTSDLVISKVGFIIVQVKNHAAHMKPDAVLFQRMDPFLCELLDDNDRPDFTVPIIRIVFALGGGKPSFQQMIYGNSLEQGAVTCDADGRPQFTSYDFWCSGIGPGLLKPVDKDDAQTKWVTLLGKTDRWDPILSTSKAPDVRRSQYPGGGDNDDHYDPWVMPDNPPALGASRDPAD